MTSGKSQWWAETERDPTHLAAADWLVRLQNPAVTPEETLAWKAWIKQDARHEQAFARVKALSQLLLQVEAPREATARELGQDEYDASVPIKEWRVSTSPARHARPTRTFALAASVAVLVGGLALAILSGPASVPFFHSPDVVATRVGENRTVALLDGSKVALGGDTRIAVSLSEGLRSVELLKGEALFTVAQDATRPFRVRAGNATVLALGTEFNVRRSSDRAVVSVTEGRVLVEPSTGLLPLALLREFKPKLRPVHLDAGQQTMAGSAGIESATKIEDPSATTAWQRGQLAFRLQPLRYVLEDVNRYAPKPIVLDDEALGALVITGMVTRENVGDWLESLERGFALRAVEEPQRVVLKAR